MVKNGYCGNEGLNCAWDLGVSFSGLRNFRRNNGEILSLDLKGSGKKLLVVSMYIVIGGHYFSFITVTGIVASDMSECSPYITTFANTFLQTPFYSTPP